VEKTVKKGYTTANKKIKRGYKIVLGNLYFAIQYLIQNKNTCRAI
jgi:hypothetical protein